MQEKKGQAASFTQQSSDLSAGNRAPAYPGMAISVKNVAR